jgi:hypothetical protein
MAKQVEDFEGKIMGALSYWDKDLQRDYWRITYRGYMVDDIEKKSLITFDARAAQYISRFGRDKAAQNARIYDETFNIFEFEN